MAFIIYINGLPNDEDSEKDLTLFMDDTTLSEIMDVSDHASGNSVGHAPGSIKKIMNFSNSQKIKLNLKKCKEMHLDFRRHRTIIPPITVNDETLERVSSFKRLGMWIDNNLKWQTNTVKIVKKGVKRLFCLKIIKNCGADTTDMHGKVLYLLH